MSTLCFHDEIKKTNKQTKNLSTCLVEKASCLDL